LRLLGATASGRSLSYNLGGKVQTRPRRCSLMQLPGPKGNANEPDISTGVRGISVETTDPVMRLLALCQKAATSLIDGRMITSLSPVVKSAFNRSEGGVFELAAIYLPKYFR